MAIDAMDLVALVVATMGAVIVTQVPQPFGGNPQFPIPGRIIREVKRYPMPDGSFREKRMIQRTFQAPDGTVVTDTVYEVDPPLDCPCVPKDMHDVIQCPLCQFVVCKTVHSFVCSKCSLTYCAMCRIKIESEQGDVELCAACGAAAMTPAIVRIFTKWVWSD